MAAITNNRVIGNVSGASATPSELTGAQLITMMGLATVATSGSASDLGTGTLPNARLPASPTFSGNITAANKVDGFSYNVTGATLANERYILGIAQYAMTISQTTSIAKSLVAATASTVFTIKKGTVASPTTIGTFTFAAAGTTATVSITAGVVSSGDMLWIEAPATPDATLQDLAFVVRT
jgi:hypothetical protein